MSVASHSIEIARPAREVFSYLSNVENDPAWRQEIRSCRWTSDDHWSVGATYVVEERILGIRVGVDFLVTEFEAGRLITAESSKRFLKITRLVEPLGVNRCRLTLQVREPQGGFARLFASRPTKNIASDYRRLKGLLESL